MTTTELLVKVYNYARTQPILTSGEEMYLCAIAADMAYKGLLLEEERYAFQDHCHARLIDRWDDKFLKFLNYSDWLKAMRPNVPSNVSILNMGRMLWLEDMVNESIGMPRQLTRYQIPARLA
jgi:hypothetical protein